MTIDVSHSSWRPLWGRSNFRGTLTFVLLCGQKNILEVLLMSHNVFIELPHPKLTPPVPLGDPFGEGQIMFSLNNISDCTASRMLRFGLNAAELCGNVNQKPSRM